jgi:antitoxin PrlF
LIILAFECSAKVRHNYLTLFDIEGFVMSTLTVTTKGQITLRQDLLKHLGVMPGQKVEVHKLPDGTLTLGANLHEGDLADFIACLHKLNTPAVSIDALNEAIAQGWADHS